MLKFRDLRADEIECRVSTCSEKGVSLLLYKDARCDMNILDETVGPMDWRREHLRENANCIVSIWDPIKKMWVSKEDTGTESYTEKEKGLASDSFKRACFNWGIGRELYTAPFIWIKAGDVDIKPHPRDQKAFTTYDKFSVKDIEILDKKITGLSILNLRTRKVAYSYGSCKSQSPRSEADAPDKKQESEGELLEEKYVNAMRSHIESNQLDENKICKAYGKGSLFELSFKQFQSVMDEKYIEYWKQKCGAA